MSKNWKAGNLATGVTVAVKPEGGAAGDVSPIGSDGLAGYLLTDIGTAAGPNAAGLAEDYASVRLLPTEGIVELPLAGGGTEGDPVFATESVGAITYSTASGDVHIGHVVKPLGWPVVTNKVYVYLGSAGSVAAGS